MIVYPTVVFLNIASFTAAALGADANGREQSRSAFEGDCGCKVRSDLKYNNAASNAAPDVLKGTSLEPKIRFNQALFGRSRSEQLEVSPVNYLDREGSHVPFQLISVETMRGQSQTISQRVGESFEDALTRVGHKADHHSPNSEHSDLPMRYGKGGASDISSKVESFPASVK